MYSKTIEEEINAVTILINNYKYLIFEDSLRENNETVINGDVALSSKDARDCLEDPIRTVRFLKGIYRALLVLKERFKNEKITILYAGCGLFGTFNITYI